MQQIDRDRSVRIRRIGEIRGLFGLSLDAGGLAEFARGWVSCFVVRTFLSRYGAGMKKEQQGEREYPHWNRVYITVVVYTLVLIILIWAFSRMFQ
jgi:hypothetical protein